MSSNEPAPRSRASRRGPPPVTPPSLPGTRASPRPTSAWHGCWNAPETRPRPAATTSPPWINDGLPIRCPAPFRAAYEEVARRHPGCLLIDGRRELAAISPNGLIGDRVIQDTHHPTLSGYVALAGAVIRELQNRNTFHDAQPIAMPLDPADCARHFEMDAAKWATMCDRTSVHYRRVAGYRYDPAERLEKSRRYAEAATRIRGGADPAISPWSVDGGHQWPKSKCGGRQLALGRQRVGGRASPDTKDKGLSDQPVQPANPPGPRWRRGRGS